MADLTPEFTERFLKSMNRLGKYSPYYKDTALLDQIAFIKSESLPDSDKNDFMRVFNIQEAKKAALKSPYISPQAIAWLYSLNEYPKAASNPALHPLILRDILSVEEGDEVYSDSYSYACANPNVTPELANLALTSPNDEVVYSILSNPIITQEQIEEVLNVRTVNKGSYSYFREAAVGNSNINNLHIYNAFAEEIRMTRVRENIGNNPSTPWEILNRMINDNNYKWDAIYNTSSDVFLTAKYLLKVVNMDSMSIEKILDMEYLFDKALIGTGFDSEVLSSLPLTMKLKILSSSK